MSSGFKEYFKNEKRSKTIGFIGNFFSTIFKTLFGKRIWYFLIFWGCLGLTLTMFYKTLMFENKFSLVCNKIISIRIDSTNGYQGYLTIENNKIITNVNLFKKDYKNYEDLLKTNPATEYCEDVMNNEFMFYILLNVIVGIITLVYLIKLSNLD